MPESPAKRRKIQGKTQVSDDDEYPQQQEGNSSDSDDSASGSPADSREVAELRLLNGEEGPEEAVSRSKTVKRSHKKDVPHEVVHQEIANQEMEVSTDVSAHMRQWTDYIRQRFPKVQGLSEKIQRLLMDPRGDFRHHKELDRTLTDRRSAIRIGYLTEFDQYVL